MAKKILKQKDLFKTEVQRINGYLKEVVTFFDESGKPISHLINPLMVELKPRDLAQIFLGSMLLATPLSLTEEVWKLSEELPMKNIYWILGFSIVLISSFVYLNFYRFKLKGYVIEYFKRVAAIFVISCFSVSMLLLMVDKLPIYTDLELVFKRVVLIAFPAILGATLTDSLK